MERPAARSLALDIGFANDAPVVVVLLAKIIGKICATHSDGEESLRGKLRPDLSHLHRGSEPSGELRDSFFWRFRRRERPEPLSDFVAGVDDFSDGGYIRQSL